MSLVYLYREPDEDTVPDPIVLDDDRVRLYTFDTTENAEEGSIEVSTIAIDDPNGDLDIVGHRIVAVQETEVSASSNSFVYLGYAAERKVSRGLEVELEWVGECGTPAMIEISSGSPRIWSRMFVAAANSCGFTASTTASVRNAGP